MGLLCGENFIIISSAVFELLTA